MQTLIQVNYSLDLKVRVCLNMFILLLNLAIIKYGYKQVVVHKVLDILIQESKLANYELLIVLLMMEALN